MIKKKAFRKYKLDEEKQNEKNTDLFTCRLNAEERKMLEEIKECLNIKSDSKALKISARVGLNVLQATFTKPILQYLTSKERLRLDEFRKI